MKLSELLNVAAIFTGTIGDRRDAASPDPDIRSVHYQSQSVTPGGLFVAVPGLVADGHEFVGDAVDRGAVAVVVQQPVDAAVPQIMVPDSRRALARLSAGFYNHPSEALDLVGITGTNGKTTVTYLLESMLAAAGGSPGIVGTINYRYGGKIYENPVTTPESLDLQRILAEMKQAGVTHVALEVSSHAIDLSRVCACDFDVAAFTNLTQDHLDYHGTMDAYWACKKRLFTEYLDQGAKKDRAVAVVNGGNPHGTELIDLLRETVPNHRIITYGLDGNTHAVRPLGFEQDADGIQGEVTTPAGALSFRSPLVGRHNMENILCATGIALALNLPIDAIEKGIEDLPHVPGRLERVENETGRHIFVDYAHTPDALENVLGALAGLGAGRLVCIFGCGGDRDRDKRPLMGEIATRLADVAVVTSDNPRTEDPGRIIDDIVSGIVGGGAGTLTPADLAPGARKAGYAVEPDRRKAIGLGLMAASAGDVVLIAGKGHETYQIIGARKLPFDDRREAHAALSALEENTG